MACAEIAVALLAAGRARRFGSDKLMVSFQDMPLGLQIAHRACALECGWRFAICSSDAPITPYYAALGFAVIANDEPDRGQAHSLHFAVRAAQTTTASALLVLLADMPFVTQDHLRAIVATGGLAASTDGKATMPPALFPRDMWPALLTATGDSGARHLLRDARLIEASASELRDIDVVADLPRPRSV
ncbi:MAG: nucleotidyltransferase family protein [Sphingomonadaceae bacterium]|nr:nucleotidyltransferase family protein [Sphingomonadaceae bacterium]